jgi:hypothetical protein
MANIYLRVPTYVAQFYRGREVNHPLTEFEPVIFSVYQNEHVLLSATLILDTDNQNAACLSQRAWKNVLQGRQPNGGKRLLNRSPDEWPTIQEICMLTGVKKVQKMEGYDYLCIEIPKQILVGRQYKATNASFSLPPSAANDLQKMLRNNFIRVLLDWVRQERSFCNIKGIRRDLSMVVDHFFYYYNICIGTNGKDRESMRRMAVRWLEEAKTLPNDGVDFLDADDLDYVYKKEAESQDESIDNLLMKIKTKVKK